MSREYDVSDASTITSLVEPSITDVPAFADVSEVLSPVPVFGLVSLPENVAVAGSWWPVIESDAFNERDAEQRNPHVEGANGEEPSAQILLTYGDGWLVVMENFRGDLGDVTGEQVGSVVGKPANLYSVNGGQLVQWGYEGRWYGVFGRGVSEEALISTALAMTLVERY